MKNLTDDETFRVIAFFARLFGDFLPQNGADVIYLFGETRDNQASVLAKGLSLFERGVAPNIGILELGVGYGYPGHKAWETDLLRMGLRGKPVLIPSPPAGENPNTLTEAQSLVRYAKKEKWSTVVIVAPPFHIPRSFISTLTAAKNIYPELNLYAQVGEGLPWHEDVVHSQGVLKGIRIELLKQELERLEEYHAKGDILSWEDTLFYLEQRIQRLLIDGYNGGRWMQTFHAPF